MIIGFSKPKKFKLFSYLVRKVLKIPYSHVYIAFDVKNHDILIHANFKGVNALCYESFLKENDIVDAFNVKEVFKESEVWSYAVSQLGKPYSVWNILAIWLGIPLKDGEKRFICSELVLRALNLQHKVPDNATPKDVYEYLSKIENNKINNLV